MKAESLPKKRNTLALESALAVQAGPGTVLTAVLRRSAVLCYVSVELQKNKPARIF